MEESKRHLGEMAPYYGLQDELYTMQRGIKYDGDYRYDITIIPPIVTNGQYNKTKGHIHSTGHKEVYTVLEGEAWFVLQKGLEPVEDFCIIFAYKGQSVVIPGDCYHLTVNTSKTVTLKMANWIHDKCESEYKEFERKCGSCYWFFKPTPSDRTIIRRNPNYDHFHMTDVRTDRVWGALKKPKTDQELIELLK